jgi:rSAM/selenodomain-associated transferase 1
LENTLIIFIKNPRLGKVKTRLAATLGKEKALEIYHKLLLHTREVAIETNAERNLFYSDFINNEDDWYNQSFIKHLQHQNPDLGQKMFSAFTQLKALGKKKVVIIGSDCLELTSDISNSAFKLLDEKDAIIGPAKDGGYYSMGFNFEKLGHKAENILKQTFLNKKWSHPNVSLEAMSAFDAHGVSFALLPTLSDVDVEEDVLGMM